MVRKREVVGMNKLLKQSVEKTMEMESSAIKDAMHGIDGEQLEHVFTLLLECKGKVLISGCGTSAAAAKKIAHTLCCVLCPAVFLTPSDAVHGGMGITSPGDLAILISKGGCTKEISSMITPLHDLGAVVVGVTENELSQLAKESDALLKIKTEKEPDAFNMLATSSTLAVISVFDALSIALADAKKFTKKQFAVIHPGGDVGKRLTGKVLYE